MGLRSGESASARQSGSFGKRQEAAHFPERFSWLAALQIIAFRALDASDKQI
jgi:hypothetical protein